MPEESPIAAPEDVGGMDIARVKAALKSANRAVREAHFQLNQALDRVKAQNKVVGRQGQTIYQLRCEIADVRSMISKFERGEVRRLERQVQIFGEQIELDRKRLADKDGVIAELRERLTESQALEFVEEGEYQDHDGTWHPFKMDRWRSTAPEAVELDRSESEPAGV